MAARSLAELAKRTVIDALFFREQPVASSDREADSDLSSSWEDTDSTVHVTCPLPVLFTPSAADVNAVATRACTLVRESQQRAASSVRSQDAGDGWSTAASAAALGDILGKGAELKASSSSEPKRTNEYVVKDSDTLVSIAANFDITPTMLKRINRLTLDFVYPGLVLRVPPEGPKPASEQLQSPASSGTGSSVFLSEPVAAMPLGRVSPEPQPSSCQLMAGSSSSGGGMAPKEASSQPGSEKDGDVVVCKFVKLNAKYITDGNGVVGGTLLVTPNALMFDPNLADRLVIENGAEIYGVMVPMEMVMGAAIYRDAEAMSYEREHKDNPKMPKPEVYHGEAAINERSMPDSAADADSARASSPEQGVTPTVGLCTAAAGSGDAAVAESGRPGLPNEEQQVESADSCNKHVAREPKEPATSSPASAHQTGDYDAPRPDRVLFDLGEDGTAERDGDEQLHAQLGSNVLPTTTTRAEASDSSLRETAAVTAVSASECTTGGTPVDVTEEATEKQGIAIPMRQRDSQSWRSGDVSAAASAASFFTPPGLQTFIDYASGLFAPGDAKRSSVLDSTPAAAASTMPLSSAALLSGPRETHNDATDQNFAAIDSIGCKFEMEACDKSDIFQVIDDLLVKQGDGCHSSAKPLYLCLKVGVPMNKRPLQASHPIESYNQEKRPEYWFSIPLDKAECLYAFFIQWTPNIYDVGDFEPSEKGFVAISDDAPVVTEETFYVGNPKCNRKLVRQLTRDWEIISLDELKTRQTLLEAEKNLPLPSMDAPSTIITEVHQREIVQVLPLRLDGCAWHLAFGTEQHGFSLSKMYRNMQGIDSPVLLLVQDTEGRVFGAFISSPFNINEHFCGTGESFLFSFVGGFKIYSWTGKNNLFCRGCTENLWIGSGEGAFGLYLDGDIYRGRTQNCKTYDNEPLTGGPEEFVINHLEAWYFYD